MNQSNQPRTGNSLRTILLASIFVNLLLAGYILYKKYGDRISPKNVSVEYGTYEKNLLSANAAFYRMLPDDSNEIVFAGTSMTADFPLQEMFHNLKIKNRGIALTRSGDLLERVSELTSSKPAKIFIEAGINDIGTNINPDTLVSNIRKIILAIRQENTGAQIYIQSLFPSSKKEKQQEIEYSNAAIEKICKEQMVTFINTYPSFLKDGVLDPAMTFDGIQFNGKGYFTWKKILEPFVSE